MILQLLRQYLGNLIAETVLLPSCYLFSEAFSFSARETSFFSVVALNIGQRGLLLNAHFSTENGV